MIYLGTINITNASTDGKRLIYTCKLDELFGTYDVIANGIKVNETIIHLEKFDYVANNRKVCNHNDSILALITKVNAFTVAGNSCTIDFEYEDYDVANRAMDMKAISDPQVYQVGDLLALIYHMHESYVQSFVKSHPKYYKIGNMAYTIIDTVATLSMNINNEYTPYACILYGYTGPLIPDEETLQNFANKIANSVKIK